MGKFYKFKYFNLIEISQIFYIYLLPKYGINVILTMRLFQNKFMLRKLKVSIIVVSLLIVNVFGSAFAGVSTFASLNFGNKSISDINMVKECSQIAIMPSKFVNICIMLGTEFKSFSFSNKTNVFITKQVMDTVENLALFVSYRLNEVAKYIKLYSLGIVKVCASNNFDLMLFLIMLSFITSYLGLLTAKNKVNDIIYIRNIKLCPVV